MRISISVADSFVTRVRAVLDDLGARYEVTQIGNDNLQFSPIVFGEERSAPCAYDLVINERTQAMRLNLLMDADVDKERMNAIAAMFDNATARLGNKRTVRQHRNGVDGVVVSDCNGNCVQQLKEALTEFRQLAIAALQFEDSKLLPA